MYWNDEELYVEPYERKQKKYYCWKRLEKENKPKKLKFTIVVIDLTETYCAKIYDDGEIEKIFRINSDVPNKHRQGGQSAHRFERSREQQIIKYFKRINEKLKKIKNELVVCINFIYKNKFESYLTIENKNKIIRFDSTEYGGITGCYQFRNKNC